MKNIVLIGIMGCGKSTIGKIIAKRLNRRFVDLDREIENDSKMKISDIFATYGEEYFRNLEEKCALKFSKCDDLVISTGGGIVTKEKAISYLKENGVVFFVRRDLNKILKINLKNRPLLKNNPGAIFKIMRERKDLYKKYSDFSVHNTKTPKITAEKIIKKYKECVKMENVKLGIIGNPLGHTMSPMIYDLICNLLKIECDYNVCQIEEFQLESFIEQAKKENFTGFNVTIPYKQKIMKYLDDIDEFALKCNAVNTVCIRNKKLYGYNTDGEGFLTSFYNDNISVKDKNIAVLGCGGAAFGIVQKLLDEQCGNIGIFCRDIKKAENIIKKDKRKITAFSMENAVLKTDLHKYDILVNTTPLGMKNYKNDFDDFSFLDDFKGVLCDIVYNPIETNLLNQARKRGIITIDGLHMLINQGILSFEKYTDMHLNKKDLSNSLYEKIKKFL